MQARVFGTGRVALVLAAGLVTALSAAALPQSEPASPAPAKPAAQDGGSAALAEFAQPLDPVECGIGSAIADLAFTDLDGNAGKLSDFAAKKALVVVMRTVGCPVCKKYGLRLAEIERDYSTRDITFLYINTASNDSEEACRGEIAKYGFAGRYVQDLAGRFGWHLKVKSTADVFVLDPQRKLLFRGAVDDQNGRGATKPEATRHYLREALDALLAGLPIKDAALTAPGCALEFDHEPAPETATTTIAAPEPPAPAELPLTWNGRIARIAQGSCQRCHHQGGPADFELMTREDFISNQEMVKKMVGTKQMPPWFATESSIPFKNDTQLKEVDRTALLAWIDAGCPAGDPATAPEPRLFASGWFFGEPDLVVPIPKPIKIPATGVMDYQNPKVTLNLPEDVWIQGIQILPQNPSICHHVLVQALFPESRSLEFLESYLPGKNPVMFPEGEAMLLEKHAEIRFNLHYTPNGTPVEETTKIGFKFAKAKPARRVTGRILRQYKIDIPPYCPDMMVTCEKRMPYEVEIRRLIPHMHLRGSHTKVEIIYPDGHVETPLEVSKWHPDFQFAYEPVTPIRVPRGTIVKSYCWYDNSKENPFNPDPAKRVKQGEQLTDEMAGVFLEWTRPSDEVDPPMEIGGRNKQRERQNEKQREKGGQPDPAGRRRKPPVGDEGEGDDGEESGGGM